MQSNDTHQHKALENRVRREAERKGYLLWRSRLHDDSSGLYLLVGDSRGNRLPGAAAAPNAFRRGEGETLEGIAEELRHLPSPRTSHSPVCSPARTWMPSDCTASPTASARIAYERSLNDARLAERNRPPAF